MKKILFNRRPDIGGYGCSYLGDNSGHYYPATDVDKLVQEVRDTAAELRRVAVEVVLPNAKQVTLEPHQEAEWCIACERLDALLAKLTPKEG